MSDAIDSAVNRHENRALFVGLAVKRLGADRRADAELLADLMVAAIDQIIAAASVTLAAAGDDFPGREQIVAQFGEQAAKHAETIAHVAVRVMTEMFGNALLAAERAIAKTPIEH